MESTDWMAEGRVAVAAVAASTAALKSVTEAGPDQAGPSGAAVRGADPAGPSVAGPSVAGPSVADLAGACGADRGGACGADLAGLSGAAVPGAEWDDPLRVLADGCLDGLAEMVRWESWFAARKVQLAATYVRATEALAPPAVALYEASDQERVVISEVACVLTVGEGTAGAFLGTCLALTTSLPLTLAALGAGTISWAHARVMVEETMNLDPAGAAALEAHFLDPAAPNPARGCPAGELVPGRFRAKARTWRERHHPESIEKRHAKGVADRRVEFRPDNDGMAWFGAYLPADTASGIWDRTTAAARALQGPDEARTLTQLRADVAATWLLRTGTDGKGAAGDVPSPRAQVLITVPVLSLLGATEEPAMLDGYGPIPPSMARRLVADGAGSFYRVLVDPRDGAPLEIGRRSYRLAPALRQWLRLRDGRCPFPGCNNPSLDNDADHILAWADGGTTGITNLGGPCRKHHRLKHTSAWTPSGATKTSPPGWTSPTGRHYPSEQQDWEPPHWPPGILATDPDPNPNLELQLELDPDRWLPPDPNVELELDPDRGLPPEPGPDPDQEEELPADLFAEWQHFMAGHTFVADTEEWALFYEPSLLEHLLAHHA